MCSFRFFKGFLLALVMSSFLSVPILYSADSYWQSRIQSLCNWHKENSASLSLPALNVCLRSTPMTEKEAENAYVEWWALIQSAEYSSREILDLFFDYNDKLVLEGKRREEKVKADRLKSEFLVRVKDLMATTSNLGKFSESSVCGDSLKFAADSAKRACQLARAELESLTADEIFTWWGALFENQASAAQSLMYWMEQWKDLEEKQTRERMSRAAAAEKFKKSIPSLGSRELCGYFGRSRQAAIKVELKKRKELSEKEWALIDGKRIELGMSELALICSWGNAKRNRSVGPWGEHIQYVYPNDVYVYVQNGKVTSWQD